MTEASVGYNGFPRGIEDDPELLANREEKYKRVVHCEMNAILTAREPLHGYTLYVWPFLTCDRCAVHVIQAGIRRVVAPMATEEQLERWGKAFDLAMQLYAEAGVTVTLMPLGIDVETARKIYLLRTMNPEVITKGGAELCEWAADNLQNFFLHKPNTL